MTRLHNAELVNYECGRMNPLLCSRHHRQVTLAVKTVWPAKSSQQSVLPLISLVVFLLYVSGDVVTS